MEESPLLTVPEAARLLRVSRNSAYELIARGELPAIRIGRRIRISRVRLERLLDGRAAADEPKTGAHIADGARAPPPG